jgi:hypothetical protein
MYTFSSKLKNLSFILMFLGALGIGYGFFTAPKNIEDVEKILEAAHVEHGAKTAHGETTTHGVEATHGANLWLLKKLKHTKLRLE